MQNEVPGAVRYARRREEIIHGSGYERKLFSPFDDPEQLTDTAYALRSREPGGTNLIVMSARPKTTRDEPASAHVRSLVERVQEPDRDLGWLLSVHPYEKLQRRVAQEYTQKPQHREDRLDKRSVYTGHPNRSFFAAEQQPSPHSLKRYRPFTMHTVGTERGDRTIAVPTHIRFRELEEAMSEYGSLEWYFPKGTFSPEGTITADLTPIERVDRKRQEAYTTKQVRAVQNPRFGRFEGNRFVEDELRYPTDTIEPFMRKTS